jgi:glycosyltransferase involved in cell wall biosynthesis
MHNEIHDLISVIIPVYNCERYLAQAIDSVLAQTYSPLEIIVVDDGSTDDSARVAQSYSEVRYFWQENGGISAARNRGIDAITGDFVAFLDSDDLWSSEKLQRQIEAFAATPDLDVVFGWVRQFISPDIDDAIKAQLYCPPEPMAGYHAGAMLVRREALLRVGGFDPQYRTGEFLDWYKRAQEAQLQMQLIDGVVMERRMHGQNHVIQQRKAASDYARVLKAALDRKRSQQRSDGQI